MDNHNGIIDVKDSLSKIKLHTDQLLNNVHKNADDLQTVVSHVEHAQQNHDITVNSLSSIDHSLQELSTSLDWLVEQEKNSTQKTLVLPTPLQAPEKRSRNDRLCMMRTSCNIQPWYLDIDNDDDPKQKIESWINTFLIIGTLSGTDQDNTCRFAVNYLWGITKAWWNSKTAAEKDAKVYQKFAIQTVTDLAGNTVQQQIQLVPINCLMNELVNEFCPELTNKHERIIKDILQMKCCDLKDFYAYS